VDTFLTARLVCLLWGWVGFLAQWEIFEKLAQGKAKDSLV
jgi:hypothetical protein